METFTYKSRYTHDTSNFLCHDDDGLPQDQMAFLFHSKVPSERHLPDLACLKHCLYIIDLQQPDMVDFTTSTLIAKLNRKDVYSTLREGAIPSLGKTEQWQTNRDDLSCPFSSRTDGEPLISKVESRREVCDWIKAPARPGSSDAGNLAQLLSSWYFSTGTVMALKTHHRYSIQEETWSTRRDASLIRTV
jgi:hypothetical protein